MNLLSRYFVRIWRTVFSRRDEEDMAEEFNYHVDQRAAELEAAGLSPEDARREALKRFGNVASVQERAREARHLSAVEWFLSDLVHGFRSLLHARGYSLVIVVTLGISIGVGSAILSIFDSVLLKPYPWPESESLVYVENIYPKISSDVRGVSVPDYLDRREGVRAFEETAIYAPYDANLLLGDQPQRVRGLRASASLFEILGSKALLGRVYTDVDAEAESGQVVILSDQLWRTQFGGEHAAIGGEIHLNGRPHRILGVMPPGFYFPDPSVRFWVPFRIAPEQRTDNERHHETATMIARLRSGSTIASAQQEVSAISGQLRERLPSEKEIHSTTGFDGVVRDFLGENVKEVRPTLWLLAAAAVVAMAIACVNVASLVLSRAVSRAREFAVRVALGASKGRLAQQLSAEGLILMVVGSGFGLPIAMGSLAAARALGLLELPRGYAVALEPGWLLLVSAFAGVVVLALTIAPAVGLGRLYGPQILRSASTRATATPSVVTLRASLVVFQLFLSIALLSTAGLLLRSFLQLIHEPPGFDANGVLTASVELSGTKYGSARKRVDSLDEILSRVTAVGGIEHVALTSIPPFGQGEFRNPYAVVGREIVPGEAASEAFIRVVSSDYFKALGIPLQVGRFFGTGDSIGQEIVVIVDRFLAERHWPNENPVGRRIKLVGSHGGGSDLTIVGVVGSTRLIDLGQENAHGTIYYASTQYPPRAPTLLVKSSGDAEFAGAVIRDAVRSVDPTLPVYDVRYLAERIDDSVSYRRTAIVVIGFFSGIALTLASIGVYGAVSYSVAQRRQELGIRLALGATPGQVMIHVALEGARLVALGAAFGLAGHHLLGKLIGSQLFKTDVGEPSVLLAAVVALSVPALTAAMIPAYRVARTGPLSALRSE